MVNSSSVIKLTDFRSLGTSIFRQRAAGKTKFILNKNDLKLTVLEDPESVQIAMNVSEIKQKLAGCFEMVSRNKRDLVEGVTEFCSREFKGKISLCVR